MEYGIQMIADLGMIRSASSENGGYKNVKNRMNLVDLGFS